MRDRPPAGAASTPGTGGALARTPGPRPARRGAPTQPDLEEEAGVPRQRAPGRLPRPLRPARARRRELRRPGPARRPDPALRRLRHGHALEHGLLRPRRAGRDPRRAAQDVRAAQVGRRPVDRRAPLHRPRRPVPLRQHAAVPGPDREPAERELRLLLRQARRREPRVRAGAGARLVAQPHQLPGPRRRPGAPRPDHHRGAHRRAARRRVHARRVAGQQVRRGAAGQGVRQVQRAVLRPAVGRHARRQLGRRHHAGLREAPLPDAGHRLRPAEPPPAQAGLPPAVFSRPTTRSSSWAWSTSPRRRSTSTSARSGRSWPAASAWAASATTS